MLLVKKGDQASQNLNLVKTKTAKNVSCGKGGIVISNEVITNVVKNGQKSSNKQQTCFKLKISGQAPTELVNAFLN